MTYTIWSNPYLQHNHRLFHRRSRRWQTSFDTRHTLAPAACRRKTATATLSLDCPTTSFDINASGNSSDSGCDVNEYNVQIVAGSVAEGDDATLVVVTAVTPPSSLELPLNEAKSSSHGVNLCRGIAQPQELKPAALLGRSQSDKRHVEGNESGPKNATLHVANPVAIDDSPPSSPGLCFAGVNANALITRLNFLKDQMDQDELLMSLVV
ncbi:hypothetical protein IWW39_000314 [Coemansia spiralis]|uniref:Uncharacterized protein n=1 Tax=Coemansia spiralis TaxID=417178 RepID=A0A9W8GS62_9FUNG|nr:hypothetical protein IWW39_000314 [Coemansia spiralis]